MKHARGCESILQCACWWNSFENLLTYELFHVRFRGSANVSMLLRWVSISPASVCPSPAVMVHPATASTTTPIASVTLAGVSTFLVQSRR
jgi:hypothetical protein